jgi:hypothetical protein
MPIGFDKLAEGVGKAIETVPEFYDDGLKPATQESGKTLALIPRTINAALVPLRQWIAEREYNIAETEKLIAKKLEHIDEKKIVTPEPYVAIPAIQAISYSMNSDELRNLYANLLAKSMNSDTKNIVHPAYVETIKQLSPDDASYFKHIYPLKLRPMVHTLLQFPNSTTMTIARNSNLFSSDYADRYYLSLDNLSRLGLINIPEASWYGEDSVYQPIIDILKIQFPLEKYKAENPSSTGIYYDKRRVDITEYGKGFYETCVF